ncbi:MAG: hypothetical protein AB1722_00130 [Pseudomonadota bacterium]
MPWSLDYQPPKEPALLDQLFLAAGKALYLASSFEAKCQLLLRIMKIVRHYESTGDTSATSKLAKVLKEKMLGPTIMELNTIATLTEKDLAIFQRGKDARNYIAHESTQLGPLSSTSAKSIHEKLIRLRVELEALAMADNLISVWLYEIDEKEPAPRGIQSAYHEWVFQWVFEGAYGT